MDGSNEVMRATLARLQQKMEAFDTERALAWESLRSHSVHDEMGRGERWPSIATVAAR